MSNTLGTILRVLGILTLLVAGWFLSVTALYALCTVVLGLTFSWTVAVVLFTAAIAARMFYPRNVFAG